MECVDAHTSTGKGDSHPPRLIRSQRRLQTATLGVVYGVPSDITPDDIQNLVSALSARRLTSFTETNQESNYSVLLTFDGQLPSSDQVAPFCV
jgi:hypothetical protein